MIWYKPDNIIFKNRKEAKKYFGTNKYYKIEREKKDIIFIDDHKSIATNGGNQTDIDTSASYLFQEDTERLYLLHYKNEQQLL